MLVADKLGVSTDDVEVLHSDTAILPTGMDTYGSRSVAVGGTAIVMAADKVIDKARALAAHQLEVVEDDLTFTDGTFHVAGSPDKELSIQALAFQAFTAHDPPDGMEPNLHASVTWDPPNFVFPFGSHIAVVEIDTETGKVDLVDYIAVDDCGNQVNPLIVEGQVHGGIAQWLRHCSRRRSTTRTAPSRTRPSWTTWCRRPPSSRASRSTTRPHPAPPIRSAPRASGRPARSPAPPP